MKIDITRKERLFIIQALEDLLSKCKSKERVFGLSDYEMSIELERLKNASKLQNLITRLYNTKGQIK